MATLPLTVLGADADPARTAVCCAPMVGTPLSVGEAAQLAAAFKTLADPTRLRLFSLVAAHQGGEACVCEVTGPAGVSQSTVSHHLKILLDAGLLTRDQRGKWAYYRIVPDRLEEISRAVSARG